MRPAILLLLLAAALGGCVETGPGYYGPGSYGPGYSGGYHGGRSGGYYGQDPYYQQQKRQDVNCNYNWQNCAAVCNTVAQATQRAVCVANCNNALNQCKSR